MAYVFWISVLLVVYSYACYPLLLLLLSGAKQTWRDTQYLWRRHERRVQAPETLPSVSIVIAAYNEDSCIQQRVENLLALDYPVDLLNIYIGSDGSTDQTNTILTRVERQGYHPQIFKQNRGKISVLNDLVELSDDEILVMSDANTHFEPDAILRLVEHFNHPEVGGVCGELHLVDGASHENKDGIYWRYEQMLKFHESRLGCLLGANGAIYAIKKAYYQALPVNTIVDDFMIVMNISRQGKRVIYEPNACAYEEVAPSLQDEEQRRIRIGTGNYQAFSRCWWALAPSQGWLCFSYFSHKVLRWFTPHLLVLALLSNVLLSAQSVYLLLLSLQLAFYAIAGWGKKRAAKGKELGALWAFVTFFVAMNMALLKGSYAYLFKNTQGTWKRTSR